MHTDHTRSLCVAPSDERVAPRRTPPDRFPKPFHVLTGTWRSLCFWVQATTGIPHWLPASWRRPRSSYLLALLVALLAVGLTFLLAALVPTFDQEGVVLLVGITLVALTCGVGPSLLATGMSLLLTGVLLASFSMQQQPSDWLDLVLLLVSGLGLSLLAGQSRWALRRAEALAGSLCTAKASSDVERQRLRTLLDVLPVPVSMVDSQGRFVEQTPANQTIWGDPASWAHDLAELPAYPARRPDTGQPITRDDLPLVRALAAGETTLDEELEVEAIDGQRKILLSSAAPIRDGAGAIRGAVSQVQDITEHKRLEEALRRAEREAAERARELEAVFEALTDGILVYDAHGRILRTNSAARQILGFEAHPEFAALAWQERAAYYTSHDEQGRAVEPEDLAVSRLLRGEVLTGAHIAEDTLHTPDGREVAFSMTGRPLRDAGGTIVGAVSIARDETERKRLEREVAERAAQLETVFESIIDGVVVTDAQGHVQHMNQAFRTHLGLEQDQDPRGQTFPDLLELAGLTTSLATGQPLTEGEAPICRALKGEVLTKQQSVDTVFRTPTGRETLLNSAGAPIRDAAGHILGAVLVARDVTARRRLEQQTRDVLDALLAMAQAMVQGQAPAERGVQSLSQASQPGADPALAGVAERLAELTRRVLSCRSVSIAAVDAHTEALTPITVVGPSHEDEQRWWSAWEREGQTDLHLGDVLPPHALAALHAGELVLPERLPAPFLRWLQQHSQVRPSVLVPMRVGEALAGVLQIEAQEWEDWRASGEASAAEQKSALIQAVARLGALVLERERLLRERTQAQATELALRETQAQMEAFVATAAHDLRAPLTAAVGFLELAQRRTEHLASATREEYPALIPRVDAVRTQLDDASKGTQRLTRLLNVLFDTTAMRAGKLELHRAPCDLLALVRAQVEALRVAAPERTIRLHVPAAGELIMVEADPDRVGQVITNYVTNALKYSPPDRPVDVAVVARGRGSGSRARIAVCDQGSGIPKSERTRVWEPFHRVPGATVQGGVAGGSLGLGLHICKAIIQAHGGRVGAKSVVGQGSTFWFSLPLSPERTWHQRT